MAGRGNIFRAMFQKLSTLYLLYLVTEINFSENVLSVSSCEYTEFIVWSRYVLI